MKSKTLDELTSELERAVFLTVYRSREQRLRRIWAVLALSLKHGARGLLFLWPAFLAGLATLGLESPSLRPYLAILLPGLTIAVYIYIKGILADYRRLVRGRILAKGSVKSVILQISQP